MEKSKSESTTIDDVEKLVEDDKNVLEKEVVETIPISDGGVLKVTHYVKDVKDDDRVLERQIRETKEHVGDGVKFFSDIKMETRDNDGVLTRKKTTTTSSVKKSSYGDSTSAAKANLLAELSPERFPKFVPIDKKASSSSFISTTFTPLSSVTFDDNKASYSSSSTKKDFDKIMSFGHSSNRNESEIIPPTFAFELEDSTIQKGDTAYFEGTVNGTSPFQINWHLNDQLLDLNNGRYEMKISEEATYSEIRNIYITDYKISLKIKNSSLKDMGKYSLQVVNSAGDATSFAFLVIEGIKYKIGKTNTFNSILKSNHNTNRINFFFKFKVFKIFFFLQRASK